MINCLDCKIYSVKEIDSLILKVKETISINSIDYLHKVKYDYRTCYKIITHKTGITYLKLLSNYRNHLINDYKFSLCKEKLQCFIEKVKDYVVGCSDIEPLIDDSGRDAWLEANPKCGGYEAWLKGFRTCEMDIITFEEVIEEIKCEFIYDIVSKEICHDLLYQVVEEIIECNQFLTDEELIEKDCELDVQEQMDTSFCTFSSTISLDVPTCKIDYIQELIQKCNITLQEIVESILECKIEITEEQYNTCVIEYEELISNNLCSFTFSEYLKIKDCKLSYKIIKELLECNIQITYSIKDACPAFIINEKTYPLCDLDYSYNTKELLEQLIETNLI